MNQYSTVPIACTYEDLRKLAQILSQLAQKPGCASCASNASGPRKFLSAPATTILGVVFWFLAVGSGFVYPPSSKFSSMAYMPVPGVVSQIEFNDGAELPHLFGVICMALSRPPRPLPPQYQHLVQDSRPVDFCSWTTIPRLGDPPCELLPQVCWSSSAIEEFDTMSSTKQIWWVAYVFCWYSTKLNQYLPPPLVSLITALPQCHHHRSGWATRTYTAREI